MPAAAVARGKHTDSASMQPDRWEEVLDQLSSMISGKRRADGATWRDAHENMPVYLQVCWQQWVAGILARMWHCALWRFGWC